MSEHTGSDLFLSRSLDYLGHVYPERLTAALAVYETFNNKSRYPEGGGA